MMNAEMNTERAEREPLKQSLTGGSNACYTLRELEQRADRLQYALFQMARGY
jgi:hypothetical protein